MYLAGHEVCSFVASLWQSLQNWFVKSLMAPRSRSASVLFTRYGYGLGSEVTQCLFKTTARDTLG